MSEETQVEETAKRKPTITYHFIELVDDEGNVIKASEKNIRIVHSSKKIDETVLDLIKEHPNAFFIKL